MIKKLLSHPKILILVVVLLVIAWFLSGSFKIAQTEAPEPKPKNPSQNSDALFKVETFWSNAQDYDTKSTYQGYLESWQSVVLRAQLNASVEKILVPQGSQVKKGDLLIKFSDDARTSQYNQAKAYLNLKKEELKGIKALRAKNLSSKSNVLGAESETAQAQANFDNAALALSYTQPKAAFDGILDSVSVNEGEIISAGQVWGNLVDINKLKAKAQIPQQKVKELKIGQLVDVVLLDGTLLNGKVMFISASADAQTRSFRLEVEVENPKKLPLAGASASLNIKIGNVKAHKISLAYLALNDKGKLGVKNIGAGNKVEFTEVNLLNSDQTGAWVSWLPDKVQLISLGAGFTELGQVVEPVLAKDETQSQAQTDGQVKTENQANEEAK